VSNPMMHRVAITLAGERRLLASPIACAPWPKLRPNFQHWLRLPNRPQLHKEQREFGCREVYGKAPLDANKFTLYNGRCPKPVPSHPSFAMSWTNPSRPMVDK
jgi:hypothetical protein